MCPDRGLLLVFTPLPGDKGIQTDAGHGDSPSWQQEHPPGIAQDGLGASYGNGQRSCCNRVVTKHYVGQEGDWVWGILFFPRFYRDNEQILSMVK